MNSSSVIVLGIAMGVWASPAFAETGSAAIRGTTEGSTVAGTARLSDTRQGLKVSVKVSGVPPGKHGLHVHEKGDCGDGGNTAGGHFNPTGAPHGFLPQDGLTKAHAGDMGNIDIGVRGSGKLTVVLPGVSLAGAGGTHSVKDRAIILHEKPDDFGQPTGNAGGRIGCGIISVTGQ